MKFIIATIAVATLMLGAAGSAQAENLKNSYCEGETYIGKTAKNDGKGGTYPHIHCDKDFIAYSPNGNMGSGITFVDNSGVLNERVTSACDRAHRIRYNTRLQEKIEKICTAVLGNQNPMCECSS